MKSVKLFTQAEGGFCRRMNSSFTTMAHFRASSRWVLAPSMLFRLLEDELLFFLKNRDGTFSSSTLMGFIIKQAIQLRSFFAALPHLVSGGDSPLNHSNNYAKMKLTNPPL